MLGRTFKLWKKHSGSRPTKILDLIDVEREFKRSNLLVVLIDEFLDSYTQNESKILACKLFVVDSCCYICCVAIR